MPRGRPRRLEEDSEEGNGAPKQANASKSGEVKDAVTTSEFPETPPDSGRLSAIAATKKLFTAEGSKFHKVTEEGPLITHHVTTPLGHPNRTVVEEEGPVPGLSVANWPFGSQPQSYDPKTGTLTPMGQEERRTGFAEDDETE